MSPKPTIEKFALQEECDGALTVTLQRTHGSGSVDQDLVPDRYLAGLAFKSGHLKQTDAEPQYISHDTGNFIKGFMKGFLTNPLLLLYR